MANLWEDMTPEEQNILVKAHLAGSKQDNANLNRAREQLANNPTLVERLAKEEGLEGGEAVDHELDDTDPDAEETMDEEANDIERNVAESLADDVNIQETGEVSPQGDIPPPEEGESMEEYIARLAALQEKATPTRRRVPVE